MEESQIETWQAEQLRLPVSNVTDKYAKLFKELDVMKDSYCMTSDDDVISHGSNSHGHANGPGLEYIVRPLWKETINPCYQFFVAHTLEQLRPSIQRFRMRLIRNHCKETKLVQREKMHIAVAPRLQGSKCEAKQ